MTVLPENVSTINNKKERVWSYALTYVSVNISQLCFAAS